MKKLITVFLIFGLMSSHSYAATKWSTTLAEDVQKLGGLAFGAELVPVKGGVNAESILKNLVAEYTGDEDEKLVFKEIEEMSDGDETNEGLTSLRSAKKMTEFAESHIEEQLENLDRQDDAQKILELKAKIYDLQTQWPSLVERLSKKGAKFGYTGWGPGYCGVSFIEMIIIDEKEQKLYKVYLSESGEC